MAKDNVELPPQQHKRRKSTGTINLLVETRRQASDEYMRAQRAERAYRMRKNATMARTTLRETKSHFRQGFEHLGKGFKGLLAVARAVPYLAGERREIWRRKAEAKKRMRAEEMRNKLEKKLAREYAGAEGEEEEAETAEAAEGEKGEKGETSGKLEKRGKK
ncbi:hypothetical protein EKO27_g10684 [Xylaria grammica]|uniref:Uncharacterized protein n=1 Tax=Xylaria grammica TaxID=363999 RepID=A0A439CQL5_9PEZI|nr:hypothetical protein EKO27_g10684 [Xylaria grammica]